LVIDWIAALAHETGRRFPVRLVKGAYWDGEIKAAQMRGLADFPVFTRKAATDLSYLVTAKKMLDHAEAIEPQFATHNAHTLASIMAMAGDREDFEFQRLHGMGVLLYDAANQHYGRTLPVRVYAPVGGHEELLPYLVRRLLENGANSSFVAGFLRDDVSIETIVTDPVDVLTAAKSKRHTGIAPPPAMYQPQRPNSMGRDLSDHDVIAHLSAVLENTRPIGQGSTAIISPAARDLVVGYFTSAKAIEMDEALNAARAAQPAFDALGGAARAEILARAADLMEQRFDDLFRRLVREAGKTWGDAVAEIREAVDFLRYYAAEARRLFGPVENLPGPVGETNSLRLAGRGIFACISPWNFPLAIFTGQVAAALAAGNAVAAKPADQTPLIAGLAVKILHEAGVPPAVLALLPGSGPEIGAKLVADPRIAGVAFTGSTATAKRINQALAERPGPILPLIAETGGQNAFVVDSTALLEQVVDDVVASAFLSAGQRCSAARVICVQDDVADALCTLLKGAMDVLEIGDPAHLSTDVGPIIDHAARDRLDSYVLNLKPGCTIIHRAHVRGECSNGTFFAPSLIEINSLDQLQGEVFGPVLHLYRFKSQAFETLLDDIAALGFGLTFGLHSRLEARARLVAAKMPVGNIYINRSITGAVVGTQPFGGQGLSGTGPKAGGPHYLPRFAVERTLTINTAAQGGNATLLLLDEGAI
jgi:RHH-type proline utilization regulon transcriptional repressor/proline dehydrogenase/delta 1-pyrroline-5-carboxylate dehydrogenase